ncbi:MAG: DUF4252 domain-containing protein [Terriglobales bacterium]
MRLFRILVVALTCISFFQLCAAQQHNWVPKSMDALRQGASSKTEFTLDHSMLVFAAKMDPNNEDLQRVIAGVNAVSVHSYHFPATWTFDPAALSAVKDEYKAAGWQQLMNKQEKDGAGVTDVWVHLENFAISDVAVLVAKTNEVDLIVVSGSISPIDLSHLGGHFGIPKIEGGVVLPKGEAHP